MWKVVARALATDCWINDITKEVLVVEREMFPKLPDAKTPWVVKLNNKILYRQPTSENARDRAKEYMKLHP
jgi:hypothetical protein